MDLRLHPLDANTTEHAGAAPRQTEIEDQSEKVAAPKRKLAFVGTSTGLSFIRHVLRFTPVEQDFCLILSGLSHVCDFSGWK